MEIRIKTAQEFRDAHVTIEIRAEDQDEAARVAERLTGRGYWATAAEKAEGKVRDLEDQVRFLTEKLAATEADKNDFWEKLKESRRQTETAQQARDIETRRAQEYDRDRHTERDRADRAEQELAAEREVISRLEADLRRAREEMGRRFTTAQVEDAKAGAREDARAEVTREKVQPMELELAALADLLGKVNGLALGSEVRRALEYMPAEPGTHAHTISVALRRIRELLGVSWDGKAPRAPREV